MVWPRRERGLQGTGYRLRARKIDNATFKRPSPYRNVVQAASDHASPSGRKSIWDCGSVWSTTNGDPSEPVAHFRRRAGTRIKQDNRTSRFEFDSTPFPRGGLLP